MTSHFVGKPRRYYAVGFRATKHAIFWLRRGNKLASDRWGAIADKLLTRYESGEPH